MEAGTHRIPHDDAIRMSVADVMVPEPKTLPADAVVGDVRAAFSNPSVRLVVLADGGSFRGAIERGALPLDGGVDEPATRYADPAPLTARPGMPMTEALALLEQCREPRLVVLDDDGTTLRGLLCLNRGSNAFCTHQ